MVLVRFVAIIFLLAPIFASGGDKKGPESQILDRREILRCSVLLGAGITTTSAMVGALDAAVAIGKDTDKQVTIEEHLKTTKPASQRSYSRTTLESHLLLIGNRLLIQIAKAKYGLDLNNPSAKSVEESIKAHKELPANFLYAVAIGPFAEELVYRGLPSLVFGSDWLTGALSSLIFAAAHLQTEQSFDLNKIPVGAFVSGIFYWYLMREYGISHSIVAHSANNNARAVSLFLWKYFPPQSFSEVSL